MNQILTGNLNEDCKKRDTSWIFGHFVDPESPFHNKNFEIKWEVRKKGELSKPKDFNPKDSRSSLGILVRGRVTYVFLKSNKKITLENEGEYIFWKPNLSHKVLFQEDSLLLSIRWPSILDD